MKKLWTWLEERLWYPSIEKQMERYAKEHKDDVCPNCGKQGATLFDHFGSTLEDGSVMWCYNCVTQLEYESQLEGDAERWQELLKTRIY